MFSARAIENFGTRLTNKKIMEIELMILGEPNAQMRHRTVSKGKFHGTYDPSAAIKKNFLMTVQDKAPSTPITSPIGLTVIFYMPRPKGHYGTGRNEGKLKSSAPLFPTSVPDIDKLVRSTLDGMTEGGAFRDDSQVVSLYALKTYCSQDQTPGARLLCAQNAARLRSPPGETTRG